MAAEQPSRRADARKNNETILDVTQNLLAGGVLPSMSEVAAAAEVTRRTLYAHFTTREDLLGAVVRRAISRTDQALADLSLDDLPVEEALARVVQTSWPILERHRKVRTVAVTVLGPEALRDHHDPALNHVDRLIARGREERMFRTDQPAGWLVAIFYAVLHAAADEVDAGRLAPDAAAGTLTATLLAALKG